MSVSQIAIKNVVKNVAPSGSKPLEKPPYHHPLDPLSGQELAAAATACKEYAARLKLPTLRFNAIGAKVRVVVVGVRVG